MQGVKGKKVWPLDPRPHDIDIEEIAHALSHICRFGGHCREFYSVAQHSVNVLNVVAMEISKIDEDYGLKWGRDLCLAALLHDAPEAYLGDVVRPLKRAGVLSDRYDDAEMRWAQAIELALSITPGVIGNLHHLIKVADDRVLLTEVRDLLAPMPDKWLEAQSSGLSGGRLLDVTIIPETPMQARQRFQ